MTLDVGDIAFEVGLGIQATENGRLCFEACEQSLLGSAVCAHNMIDGSAALGATEGVSRLSEYRSL